MKRLKEGGDMFDLSKLGDMSKLASQAKEMQEKQETFQRNSTDILNKISTQLDEVLQLLRHEKRLP